MAVLIAAAAAALRADGLGPSSLWLDDAWVALVSKAATPGEVLLIGLTGPGYAFLLTAWLALAGFSETAAQIPAFAFGVLAPALLYLVAIARGMPVPGALLAAGLLVIAPIHVEYATRVKHYTLDTVLAIIVIGLGWALVQEPTRRRWIALVITGAAAVAVSGGLAPVVGAAFLAGGLRALRRGRAATIEAGVAALAWVLFGLAWYRGVLGRAITPAVRGYWSEYYVETAGDLADGLRQMLEGFSALPWWLLAALVLSGLVMLVTREPMLAVLVATPVAVVAMLALLDLAPLGGGRTDAVLYPGLALAIGGIAAVASAAGRRAVAVGAALVLIAGAVVLDTQAYPVEDVRPLVAQLASRREPGDRVLVYPSSIWAYALYTTAPVGIERNAATPWGFRPVVNDKDVILLEAHRDDPRRYAAAVSTAVAGASRVWLVASHRRNDLADITRALRQEGFERGGSHRRDGAEVTEWVR